MQKQQQNPALSTFFWVFMIHETCWFRIKMISDILIYRVFLLDCAFLSYQYIHANCAEDLEFQ